MNVSLISDRSFNKCRSYEVTISKQLKSAPLGAPTPPLGRTRSKLAGDLEGHKMDLRAKFQRDPSIKTEATEKKKLKNGGPIQAPNGPIRPNLAGDLEGHKMDLHAKFQRDPSIKTEAPVKKPQKRRKFPLGGHHLGPQWSYPSQTCRRSIGS